MKVIEFIGFLTLLAASSPVQQEAFLTFQVFVIHYAAIFRPLLVLPFKQLPGYFLLITVALS